MSPDAQLQLHQARNNVAAPMVNHDDTMCQNAPAGLDTALCIRLHQLQGPMHRGVGIMAQVSVHLGGHAPRHHGQHFGAHGDGQVVGGAYGCGGKA